MAARKKLVISPPTSKDVSQAAADMRKGSGPGGRVAVEKEVAIREGVAPKAGPKPSAARPPKTT